MGLRKFGNTDINVTPIGLGTWVIGGWMWGGADENDAVDAVTVSIEQGVNLIDTAPIYGFGKSEQIVGKAIKKFDREKIVIATKCGLEWDANARIRRNTSRQRVVKEFNESLKRLGTDYIDIYQVHWPDTNVPISETMDVFRELLEDKKIRAIGVSNFNVSQMKEVMDVAPLHSLQPPFNIFEQEAGEELLPFCNENNIAALTYSTLCRGLLTGKFTKSSVFQKGDLRKMDPKFKGKKFQIYLNCIEQLKKLAQNRNASIGQLAIEWAMSQPGVTCVLVGARNSKQAEQNINALKQKCFSKEDFKKIEQILYETVNQPLGAEFMAPPE
ncbi:aldo/keto reductase [bacterium]|nr:aldo/keto reductase [bacterium]